MVDDIPQQREAQLRGEKAKAILESPIWEEAWKVYEDRLLEEFKGCKTDDLPRLQQIKMLHLAGIAAKKHLEAIVTDGKFAAKNIEFAEKRSKLSRVVTALRS